MNATSEPTKTGGITALFIRDTAVFTLLAFLGLAVLSGWMVFKGRLNTASGDLARMAEESAAAFDEIVRERIGFVRGLAGTDTLKQALGGAGETARAEALLAHLAATDKSLWGAFVADGKGVIRAGTARGGAVLSAAALEALGRPVVDVSDRPYFQAVANKGENSFVSAPFAPKVDARDGVKLAYAVAAPLRNQSRIAGILVLVYDLGGFAGTILAPAANSQGHAFMVDAKGRYAHHSDPETLRAVHAEWARSGEAGPGPSAKPPFMKEAASLGNGVFTFELDGRDTIIAVAASELTGAIMGFSEPVSTLLDAARGNAVLIAVAGLALALALLLMLFLRLRGLIARPLAAISGYVNAVANRNYTADLDETGLRREFAGLGRDMRKMVDQLKYELGRSQGVLNGVPYPFLIADTKENILHVNQAMVDLTGHMGAPEEWIGRNVSDFFYGDATRPSVTRRCLESGMERFHQESEYANIRGERFDISINVVKLYDLSGALEGAFSFIIDLTPIKEGERKLATSHEAMVRTAELTDGIVDNTLEALLNLTAAVDQTNENSDRQRVRTMETATAMEEMNATVMEVARNAGMAAESSDQARHRAGQGAEVVDKAVNAITQVRDRAIHLKESMSTLGEQSESIGRVMTVITDIADQTNLLALNAAIEAARAGEAGRGFAVVADEVRKLAEKTMVATKEVGDAITAIQLNTKDNMASMDAAAELIGQATELAQESGRSLEAIVSDVQEVSSQIGSIATAAEQQSAASEEINASVDDVNNMATEISQGMRGAMDAVSRLRGLMDQVKTRTAELRRAG